MQTSDIVEDVWSLEIVRQLYKTEDGRTYDDFSEDAKQLIPGVVNFISSQYDFGFNVDEYTIDTVVDQVDYVIKGRYNDCRDVINIRYGGGTDTDTLLEKVDYLKFDRDRSTMGNEDEDESDTQERVSKFAVFGQSDDGFPKIELWGKPTEVKTLTYRYRKTGIRVQDIPESFRSVMSMGIVGRLVPTQWRFFERALAQMVHRYEVGGDDYEQLRLDPKIRTGNIRRQNLYGND